MRPNLGRRIASAKPAVVATTIWTAHEPNAITSVLIRYRSMWTLFQAVTNCDRSKPEGHSAIG
jgi:hypothetical protein